MLKAGEAGKNIRQTGEPVVAYIKETEHREFSDRFRD
jgi:hypothetical protein